MLQFHQRPLEAGYRMELMDSTDLESQNFPQNKSFFVGSMVFFVVYYLF